MIQRIKDMVLEFRIRLALTRMIATDNKSEQRKEAELMARLHRQRSTQQIERMERKMGLR